MPEPLEIWQRPSNPYTIDAVRAGEYWLFDGLYFDTPRMLAAYRERIEMMCRDGCSPCYTDMLAFRRDIRSNHPELYATSRRGQPSQEEDTVPLNLDARDGRITPDGGEEGTLSLNVSCKCDTCKASRGEQHKLKRSVVHNYSYRPSRGWSGKVAKDDLFNYYLGVELETERPNTTFAMRNGFTNQVAADMRRPKQFWVAKADGSVSGPEFASHPATLTWWHDHMKDIAEMLRMLIHAGYRSHDGGTAGMHVNISRDAFNGADHLGRFMGIVHRSIPWSLAMSQRRQTQMERWAVIPNMSGYGASSYEGYVAADAREAYLRWNGGYFDKYRAIHTPARQQRIEFRLPRGTLRLDRFYKNLEWTNAMVEFTRQPALDILSSAPAAFMTWARENAETYPNLVAFLDEKRDVLDAAATADNF